MWTEEESGEDTPGGRATEPFLGCSEQSLGHGTRAGPWASACPLRWGLCSPTVLRGHAERHLHDNSILVTKRLCQ